MASAGCRKNDGVPVDASVALTFLQMMPDLPRPIVTTRPAEALISSTTSTKVLSRWSMSPRIAADSTSSTRRASAMAGCTLRHEWRQFFAVSASRGMVCTRRGFSSAHVSVTRDLESSTSSSRPDRRARMPFRRSAVMSLRPRAVPFLRQENARSVSQTGVGTSGLAAEADDGAELGIELGRLAVDDVALERRGGLGRQARRSGPAFDRPQRRRRGRRRGRGRRRRSRGWRAWPVRAAPASRARRRSARAWPRRCRSSAR